MTSFELTSVRRVFVRAPNWVGDLVMATASFARLRAAFPQARLAGAMRPHLRSLLTGTSFFDDIVAAPRARGLRGLLKQVGEVRAGSFDLAVVLPNSLETGLVPYLAGVPWRLGYRQGRPGLMNLGLKAEPGRRPFWRRRGPRRVPVPMPRYYADLLDLLGIPPGGERPVLAVTDEESHHVQAWLERKGVRPDQRIVMLTAGASYGSSKLWMPERFAAVARHFRAEHDAAVLVLVGPGEVELGERIAAEGSAICCSDPVFGLDHLKALIARGDLLITGDTGPRHLAVAFDKPVVCLIGPTDPRYTSYCLDKTVLIRREELDCLACQRKVCPLGHHRCMRDITVEQVVEAGERLLG